MENKNVLTFDDNEIIIRITPKITNDFGWDGDLAINFEVFENNSLDPDQYASLMALAQMMGSLPLLMEADDNIRQKVGDFYEKNKNKSGIEGRTGGFYQKSTKKRKAQSSKKSAKNGNIIQMMNYRQPEKK